jgi:hypothetical protein
MLCIVYTALHDVSTMDWLLKQASPQSKGPPLSNLWRTSFLNSWWHSRCNARGKWHVKACSVSVEAIVMPQKPVTLGAPHGKFKASMRRLREARKAPSSRQGWGDG